MFPGILSTWARTESDSHILVTFRFPGYPWRGIRARAVPRRPSLEVSWSHHWDYSSLYFPWWWFCSAILEEAKEQRPQTWDHIAGIDCGYNSQHPCEGYRNLQASQLLLGLGLQERRRYFSWHILRWLTASLQRPPLKPEHMEVMVKVLKKIHEGSESLRKRWVKLEALNLDFPSVLEPTLYELFSNTSAPRTPEQQSKHDAIRELGESGWLEARTSPSSHSKLKAFWRRLFKS